MLTILDVLVIIDRYMALPVLVLSVLLIYLSVKSVTSSLSRTYCLNIAIPSLLFAVFAVFVQVVVLMRQWSFLLKSRILFFFVSIRFFTLYSYLYFSTLTIFLAYIGYARPQLFQKLVNTRNVAIMVFVGYLWIAISIFTLFPRAFSAELFQLSEETDFSIIMVIQLFVVLIIYTFMVVLYIVALIHMRKRIAIVSGTSLPSKIHRKVLKSVLIYCTAPNAFCALALSYHVCETVAEVRGFRRPSYWPNKKAFEQWSQLDSVCVPLFVWSHGLANLRVMVNVLTALVAFHDYRTALVNAIRYTMMRAGITCIRKPEISDGTSPSRHSASGRSIQVRHK
ncbi:hypothetical protein QR680_004017 [Steinernema hermaphroditum]|uniref:G-protein coupled receptors family 1 profile domain-containing protein n=1 Tax=Steinernema hermaphroditum TaxID=289476 RepID=A0AA39LTA8_9BILA|nr:hypothetical protein QR680_004017 [Steinernema hermaphroditum]